MVEGEVGAGFCYVMQVSVFPLTVWLTGTRSAEMIRITTLHEF